MKGRQDKDVIVWPHYEDEKIPISTGIPAAHYLESWGDANDQ